MMLREQEAEIAKTDYLVSSMALLYGIPKEAFEGKMKALQNLKRKFVSIVTQQAYDPDYQQSQVQEKQVEEKKTQDIMQKLEKLGK